MMNIFTSKKIRPFQLADVEIHTYPGFKQYKIKEKVWQLTDNINFHRIYLYNNFKHTKEFVCDIVANETILILVQQNTVKICNKYGQIYFLYSIKGCEK